MTSADLWAEFNSARRAMTRADRDRLVELGIEPADVLFLVGKLRARRPTPLERITCPSIYQPYETGIWTFISPVLVHQPISPETDCPAQACRFGELVDLVAWDAQYPHAFALRVGAAEWIGSYEPQFMDPDPVPVHRGVLEWLRSRCRGIVLLSHDPASQYRILANIQHIEAQDEEHVTELRAVLQRPWPTPPISIAQRRERHDA